MQIYIWIVSIDIVLYYQTVNVSYSSNVMANVFIEANAFITGEVSISLALYCYWKTPLKKS